MMLMPLRLGVTLLFFFSGLAALIYQVAWQRWLVVFAGGDLQATTIVVTAFMIGLGLGSLAGGRLADAQTTRQALKLFAAAEAALALFGWLSPWLLQSVLIEHLGGVAHSRLLTALVLLLGLLLPTLLMGVSLPLLSRATVQGLDQAASSIGRLYGVNTLGAAMGSLVATWVLMPPFGLAGSLRVAAGLNALCALSLLPMLKHWPEAEKTLPEKEATPSNRPPLPMTSWWLLAGLSGFIALGFEMLWFRLLGVLVKSTAFTFGTLLAVYLGGLGLGSLAGTWLAARSQQPQRHFLLLQTAVGLSAGLITLLVLTAVTSWPSLRWVRDYLGSYEPMDANTAIVLWQKAWQGSLVTEERALLWIFPILHGLLPLLLIGVPTLIMGLSYPLLQKVVQNDLAQVGRRVGGLQTANLVGSILGAVLAGTVLLPGLGTAAMLKLLVLLSSVMGLGAMAFPTAGRRWGWAGGMLIALGLTVLALPDQKTLWAQAHGTTVERLYLAEDGAGVSVLKKPEAGSARPETQVMVNGIGQSWIPFGGIHTVLGALPALLHPRPEHIAIIGLGSGDTLYAASVRPETRELVCVEIIGAQLETLRACATEMADPGLQALLADERIRHVGGDGRMHLLTTEQRFDIIEADALRPTSRHSGNLYSEEYFRLVSQRLKPGGFAVTWAASPRVHDTMVRVFPHVLSFPQVLIGSMEPIPLEVNQLRLRVQEMDTRYHFQRAGIDIRALLEPYIGARARVAVFTPETDRSAFTQRNTDAFPKDELALPALWGEP